MCVRMICPGAPVGAETTSFLCCKQWPFRSLLTTSAPQVSHLLSNPSLPLFILRLTVGGGAVV